MAATVIINRLTGSSPTKTNITGGSTRMSASDDPNPGSSHPIPVPADGVSRSFWVTTRLECVVAPDGEIDNLRWYTDGGNGFGSGITCVGQEATSYVEAEGTEGESGVALSVANHEGLTDEPVDVFSFTSASPKSVAGSTTGTGEFGSMFVYQLVVDDEASAGTTGSEQFTWAYDET